MRNLVVILFVIPFVACQQKRVPPYNKEAVSRGADSIAAVRYITAARESGMPSYYNLDHRELVVEVDTSKMTESVDSFACDFFNLAKKHRVNPQKCTVIDYYSKDTLKIYE